MWYAGRQLLEKSAQRLESPVRRVGPVVDIARRRVGHEQIERAAVAERDSDAAAAPFCLAMKPISRSEYCAGSLSP